MNTDPKKVYILENRIYTEITYEQLCKILSTDDEYKKKHHFIRLHGILMEVICCRILYFLNICISGSGICRSC